MWPSDSDWLEIGSESSELLAQCRGLQAQAWSYSASHSQLLVRFYQPSKIAGIYLYCKACDFVQFERSWEDVSLTIKASQEPHGKIYTITDGDRLRIVCGAAWMAVCSEFVHIPSPKV